VVGTSALNPHFVDPGHFIVHGLPLAAAGGGRWRCCSHGLKDCLDLCRYLVRQAIEELDRGRGRAGPSSLWRWKKWISHGSGTVITTGQARNKPLDLPDNHADRGEILCGQGPVGRDDERNLAIRERRALV